MLDMMTPEQFEERWAADRLDNEAWRIGGMIAAEVANGLRAILFARAGKSTTPQDFLDAEDFVPLSRWQREERAERRRMTPEESLADLSRMVE